MRSLIAAALLAFPCAVLGAPSSLSKRAAEEATNTKTTTPSSPPHVNMEVFDGQVNLNFVTIDLLTNFFALSTKYVLPLSIGK